MEKPNTKARGKINRQRERDVDRQATYRLTVEESIIIHNNGLLMSPTMLHNVL